MRGSRSATTLDWLHWPMPESIGMRTTSWREDGRFRQEQTFGTQSVNGRMWSRAVGSSWQTRPAASVYWPPISARPFATRPRHSEMQGQGITPRRIANVGFGLCGPCDYRGRSSTVPPAAPPPLRSFQVALSSACDSAFLRDAAPDFIAFWSNFSRVGPPQFV